MHPTDRHVPGCRPVGCSPAVRQCGYRVRTCGQAHILLPARNHNVGFAALDSLGRQMQRFQARPQTSLMVMAETVLGSPPLMAD